MDKQTFGLVISIVSLIFTICFGIFDVITYMCR